MDIKNKTDYVEFLQEAIDSLKDDSFYNAFQNSLGRGKNSLTIYRKQNVKSVDKTWIDVIEDSIIAFDNIVRNPRKYIAREEEIVPIELSRSITTESVKHLAQHTNMIAEIDGDKITPNKILNINKEESFEVYENRFAYTTLLKTKEFIDKRIKLINDSANENNIINVNLESMFKYGDKTLDFSIKLKSKSLNSENKEDDKQLNDDIARVQKLSGIINTFCASPFAQTMSKFALVRPPITRTNAILKNPNFKKCLTTWQFLNTYEKVGYEIHSNESLEDISKQSFDNLSDNIFLNYLFYYNMIILNTPQEKIVRKSKYSPKFIKKFLENVVNSGDVEDIDLQNVVRMQANSAKSTVSQKQEKSILAAIDKAFIDDEKYLLNKQKAIEAEEKAKAEAAEKERIRREKQKAIEAARREKAKARELARKEKAKEKARLAKEAQMAKARELAKKKKVEELKKKLIQQIFLTPEIKELINKKVNEERARREINAKAESKKQKMTLEEAVKLLIEQEVRNKANEKIQGEDSNISPEEKAIKGISLTNILSKVMEDEINKARAAKENAEPVENNNIDDNVEENNNVENNANNNIVNDEAKQDEPIQEENQPESVEIQKADESDAAPEANDSNENDSNETNSNEEGSDEEASVENSDSNKAEENN